MNRLDEEKWIIAEGDSPKLEKTRRYFAELRASLKNGLDVASDLGMEVARLQTDLDEAVKRAEAAEQALVDLHESLFIGSERGLSKEALAAMAAFAKRAALDASQARE